MDVRIRRGRAADAEFLAWAMLAASRAHMTRGLWDLIINSDEAGCLDYLKRLALAEPRSLYHCESFLVAEADGAPAAALSGFILQDAWAIAGQAMSNVQRDLGWSEEQAAASYQRVGPIWTNCLAPDAGADLAIESVATRPEYRRHGLVCALIDEVLSTARAQGCRLAQIVTYIGNQAAIGAYEKSGFDIRHEKRCRDMQDVLGAQGFVRLLHRLDD
jgi:ribosomal protein S18 acetylase RimI-like enzyme